MMARPDGGRFLRDFAKIMTLFSMQGRPGGRGPRSLVSPNTHYLYPRVRYFRGYFLFFLFSFLSFFLFLPLFVVELTWGGVID